MAPINDKCQICSAIKHGDAAIIQAAYSSCLPGLVHRLKKAGAGKVGTQEPEDFVQSAWVEVMVKVSSGLDCKFVRDESFCGFLYAVAYNLWRNYSRKEERMTYFEDFDGAEPSYGSIVLELLESHELRDQVAQAMTELREEDQAILDLRLFEEHSFDEIGILLNIGAQNARQRFARAKSKLIGKLGERELTEKVR